MRKGRKTKLISNRTTRTTTYGYLSDDDFEFAHKTLSSILKKHLSAKQNLLEKIERCRQQLIRARSNHSQFAHCLSYLDKHLNRKISPEEARKISSYHQPSYCDDLLTITNQTEKQLDAASKFLGGLTTYTSRSLEMVGMYERELAKNSNDLTRHHSLLEQDVSVLKKHVGFFERVRLSRVGYNPNQWERKPH